MNSGKQFEQDFKNSISKNIYWLRLNDPAQSFGDNKTLRFSPNNPYDIFIYLYPNYFPFELKSTQGTSFSIQKNKEEKGKDIKLNQIEGLTKASQYDGVCAGFIFNFRKVEHTYWLNIKSFNGFNINTIKKSINENDVIEFGGILIGQRKKKVRYSYDVDKMIEDIKNNGHVD